MNSSFLIPHSSFIIACRNEISNLPTLLESIENQSFKPSEVIIVDDNSTIDIKVCSRSHNFLIAVDGRNESCDEEVSITVRKANYRQLIIRGKSHSFIQNLQEKLMWGRDVRE